MKRLLSYSASLLLAMCLALVVTTARAQLVPRTVLLEEGTNWSCGPCAVANPGVEAFLQSHGDSIIQIAYHPNWPGADDPMYMNDTRDNQGRVSTYYGVTGVPAIMIDGSTVTTSPASYEQAFTSRIAKLSPVAISISRSVSGTTVTVTVTVNAVADVSSYKKLVLRVAAVQRYVDTTGGTNGEKRFMNPMRTMMPNLNGTAITLVTGVPQTFTFSYDIKSSYRSEKMYEVAFVQNDPTKEVLQAAATLQSFSVAAKAGEPPVQVISGASGTLDVQVHNTTGEDLTFTASYKSIVGNDWGVTLTGPGATSIPVANTQFGDIQLSITPGTSAYTSGILTVSTITGRRDTVTTNYVVKFISPSTKIAFVDVSGDSASSVTTLKTLTAMKLRYVPLTDVEAASAAAWSSAQFSTIIIEANKWIVAGSNKAAVASYLQSGGHLLVHGGEIAYGLADPSSTPADQDPTWLATVLHATYVKDSAGPFTVHGVTGDVVSNTFASPSVNINAARVDAQNQPDQITATNGAIPIFYYGVGTAQVAGIRWDDGNAKLVYLAFGLQNLAANTRQAITTAALNWFGVQAGVASAQSNALAIGNSYPNPFTSSTTIPYSLTRSEAVRISIVDARGAEVATLVDGFESIGDHTASFDASHLARGTYFCVIHTSEGSAMRPLTIE